MMDRRQFVNFIALIAAGSAARPEQIEAYRQYYEANTPMADNNLVAVDEVWISGMAIKSTRVECEFLSTADPMVLGLNAYGGIVRWVASPEQKIITTRGSFRWTITSPDDADVLQVLRGHVSYIDHTSKRHNQPIDMLQL